MGLVVGANNYAQDTSKLIPPGSYYAYCYLVADIGTQKTAYKGMEDERKQVVIGWELIGGVAEDGKPLTIHNTYTASLGDKALLTKHLTSWRSRPFTNEEREAFDLRNIVGHPCILNIVHNGGGQEGSRVYTNVAGVMACPTGMQLSPMIHKPVLYDVYAHEQYVFNGLPSWLQDKIRKSLDFSPVRNEVQQQHHAAHYAQGPIHQPAPQPQYTQPVQPQYTQPQAQPQAQQNTYNSHQVHYMDQPIPDDIPF